MTEREWLGCADPTPMIEFMQERGENRKVRLFSCTCCRRIVHLLSDPRSFHAIDVAERGAEGLAHEDETEPARLANFDVYDEVKPHAPWDEMADYAQMANVLQAINHAWRQDCCDWAAHFASTAVAYDAGPYKTVAWTALYESERAAQADLMREHFGNPFRPITINPAWLTPTVLDLAQAAYDERILPSGELDPERLAVLSDALEEAGCDNEDILSHLRGPGPHVRGCWAIDLLLGKE